MIVTGDDLSIARPSMSRYQNFRGKTAHQSLRDALEQWTIWRLIDLMRRCKDRNICAQAVGRAMTALGVEVGTVRIQVIPPYWGALQMQNGGIWDLAHHRQGRDYQADDSSLREFRAELMALVKNHNTVASSLLSDPDLRALLNINDTLNGPKYLTNPDLNIPLDVAEQSKFPIDTRKNLPPYGGGDGETLLEIVDASHHATAGGPPSEVSFSVARNAYESASIDESVRWFRRLAPVAGLKDPDWSPTQLTQLEALTHVYYGQWSAAQRVGDTKVATRADHQHRLAHIMLAIGADDRLLVCMPDEHLEAKHYADSYGGKQTSRELLPVLVEKYGL